MYFNLSQKMDYKATQIKLNDLNRKLSSAITCTLANFRKYIFMCAMTGLLYGCTQKTITILDLSCDSKCENLYLTISTPGNKVFTTVFNINSKEWIQLTGIENVKFSYLSGDKNDNLIASNDTEILAVNLEKNSYSTLYKHPSHVFYPTKTEDSLYFSESTSQVHGTRNPYQSRILWKLDRATNVLSKGLLPWGAYQIGRPFIVNDKWLYIDLILPKILESDDKEPGMSNDLHPDLKNQTAYKLALDDAFTQRVNTGLLLNGRLFTDHKQAEQISIDRNGNYLGFYSLSSTPSSWNIYDTKKNETVVSINSSKNDRLVVSPDGSAYAYVAGDNDYINVYTGRLSDKESLINQVLLIKELKQKILGREEK